MHVGDLDDNSNNPPSPQWQAQVVVTIHDASHSPVDSATVTAVVTFGSSFATLSCATGPSGQCQLAQLVDDTVGNATFIIVSVTKSGFSYNLLANHDPDGDSTGTVITVNRP